METLCNFHQTTYIILFPHESNIYSGGRTSSKIGTAPERRLPTVFISVATQGPLLRP